MSFQQTVTRTPHQTSPATARLCLIDASALGAGGVSADPGSVWQRVRAAAELVAAREPLLRRMLDDLILLPSTPAEVLAAVLARRLGARDIPHAAMSALFEQTLQRHPAILPKTATDLCAIGVRDPACPDPLHALLNLKGFHALQTYRIAHALWEEGRHALAYSLSNQAAAAFAIDIHPAARIGAGVMLDHGTGIVIGETAVIDDDVSILQNVTLGGTGKEQGDRHPKIRSGVMLGAGAKILGNIEIGAMSRIAAGSVVLKDVPPHCTVAGVPGRVVRYHSESHPAVEMDQML